MAATKTYETAFKLSARYTGQPAFNKLNSDVSRTQRNINNSNKALSNTFAGIGKGVAAVGAAFVALEIGRRLLDFGKNAIKAAMDVEEAHERVTTTLKKNAIQMGLNADEVAKSNREILKVADSIEKAGKNGGQDAEAMAVGLANLSKAFKPDEIIKGANAFGDYLTLSKGLTPSLDDSAAASQELVDFIKTGRGPALKLLNVTKEQRKVLGKMTEEQRKETLRLLMGRVQGEMGRQFDTTKGKFAALNITIGNIMERLGEPFAKRAGLAAEKLREIALKPEVQQAVEDLAIELDKMIDGFNAEDFVQKVSDMAEALKALKVVGESIAEMLNNLNRQSGDFGERMGRALWGNERYEQMQKMWPSWMKSKKPKDQQINADIQDATISALDQQAAAGGWEDVTHPRVQDQVRKAQSAADDPRLDKVHKAQEKAADTSVKASEAAAAVNNRASSTAMKRLANPPPVSEGQANIRYKNPGAQWPSQGTSGKYGSPGYGVLNDAEQNRIAKFDTFEQGGASNMELLAKKYTGMRISDAMYKWSGSKRRVPGTEGKYDPNAVITDEMMKDPNFVIPFMKAIASGEGKKYPMSDEQWQAAYKLYESGGKPPINGGIAGASKDIGKPSASNGSMTYNAGGINVNTTSNATADEIAEKVKMSLDRSSQDFLSEGKKARNMEDRLRYV